MESKEEGRRGSVVVVWFGLAIIGFAALFCFPLIGQPSDISLAAIMDFLAPAIVIASIGLAVLTLGVILEIFAAGKAARESARSQAAILSSLIRVNSDAPQALSSSEPSQPKAA